MGIISLLPGVFYLACLEKKKKSKYYMEGLLSKLSSFMIYSYSQL